MKIKLGKTSKVSKYYENDSAEFIIGNCLFAVVRLTKNANKVKYVYSGYGFGFD